METMRVYEFARICGKPAKELVAQLQQAGFDVKSHMSVLSKNELEFLNKNYLVAAQQSMDKQQTKNLQQQTTQAESPMAQSQQQVPAAEKVNKSISTTLKSKKTKKTEGKAILSKAVHQITEQNIVPEIEKKPIFHDAIVIEPMTVADFALKTNKLASEVILTLLRMGIVAAKNQVINEEIIEKLVEQYQIKTIKKTDSYKGLASIASEETAKNERAPVVVVVGHVDHGKTTLLDFIRKTKVAAREKGGITQHLGAYTVNTQHGKIVFLDTPGHEAFSKMRGRGIGVADIAILIVAADDGVMPQTVEAIRYAQEAKLPIIVAINKIDKVDKSRVDAIKQGIAQYGLLPEEWGGDVVCVPVSAKVGTGVDHLLEMIALQSQIMELRADSSRTGIGHVLESKLEKGRGPIATILCKHGTVKIGDHFVCGNTVGKISSLTNSAGERIQSFGPSEPVAVAGFENLPEVGALFRVVPFEEYRLTRDIASSRKTLVQRPVAVGAINLLIKTDTISTKEALLGAMEKLARGLGKEFNIVSANVGNVNESDVELAVSTSSSIITLHVKPEVNAALLARTYGVEIAVFDIIYKLLENLEERLKGKKTITMVKTKIGSAIVRQVFSIKNIGVVAGCYVQEGRFTREGNVIVLRRGKQIGAGAIKSLQRERKVVKEVHSGFECGFVIDGFEDFLVDDQVDCYIQVPVSK